MAEDDWKKELEEILLNGSINTGIDDKVYQEFIASTSKIVSVVALFYREMINSDVPDDLAKAMTTMFLARILSDGRHE